MTPEYQTWRGITERCTRASHPSFKNYGGRGIRVCERWRKFENFLADMGARPRGMSLDRIDPSGNYEPGNCRWATPAEQTRNKRNNRFLTVHGETLCLTDWATRQNVRIMLIVKRLAMGWSVEDAVLKPVRRMHTFT